MLHLISRSPISSDDQIAEIATYQWPDSLRIHAHGFLDIAIIAAERALKNGAAIDSLAPAIMYTIRHAAELFLKYVVAELADQHENRVSMQQGHRMLEILKSVRPNIEAALECEASHSAFDWRAWLDTFESVLVEVDQVDPDGQGLRYPLQRNGSPNLGGTLQVSLRQLAMFAHAMDECFMRFVERGC